MDLFTPTLSNIDAFIAAFVFLLVLSVLVPRIFASKSRSKPPYHNHRRTWVRKQRSSVVHAVPAISKPPAPHATKQDLAAEQLSAVMASTFTAKHVLSRTEAQVMRAAEKAIAEAGLDWRVMAQVSLGEVLDSPSKAAFLAINAKRVDLLIMSAKTEPLAAIEYQGQGHYQGTAPARDAIKKEALRKAGIRYIEITFEHGPQDVKREIERMAWLGKLQSTSPGPPITAIS